MNWVYMLRCKDGTLYTGWTNDLQKRLTVHNAGKGARYTRGRRPVQLAWAKQYESKSQAMVAEAALKKLPKQQKEDLVAGFIFHSLREKSEEIMKKSDFKRDLIKLCSQNIEGMNFQEKMTFAEEVRIDFYASKENEKYRDCSQKGKPWTDEELYIILQDAPTKANCLKYAILFKRGYGSIEQIYRWAATSDENVLEKRPNDPFIKQIKKVSKNIKLRL